MAFNPRLTAGAMVVGGPAADDAAASGNPVPMGGIYNSARPTYTNLDRTQMQSDTRGNIPVVPFAVNSTNGQTVTIRTADGVAGNAVNNFDVNATMWMRTGGATTFDRAVSIVNATDSTGTGIAAAGILAQVDDVSPSTVTENQFGNVRMSADRRLFATTPARFKTATPAVTAGAYTTGQCVGALNTITTVVGMTVGSGLIKSCIVTVKTALTAPYDVIFFSTNPTNSTFTDNSALAVNVLDLQSICGVAHCTEVVSLGTPQMLQAPDGLAIPFTLAASTSLYAAIVIRGGQTFASTSAIGLNVEIIEL